MHEILVVTSTVLGLYSPLRYIQDIRKGRCKPHRVTRFALCISLLLTFFSTHAAHGNFVAQMLTGTYAVCAIYAFVLSLTPRGVGGTSKADVVCLLIALGGTAGWTFSGDPLIAVACSIAADIAAYIPTVIKTWSEPGSEAHWTYTSSVIASGISVLIYPFTMGSWFTAYLVLIGVVMVGCIKRLEVQSLWTKFAFKRV